MFATTATAILFVVLYLDQTNGARLSRHLHKRIVSGSPLQPTEKIPWLLSMQEGRSHFCQANLIEADIAVTAAHCLYGKTEAELRAIVLAANRYDLSKPSAEEGGANFAIKSCILHPDYDKDTVANDLAVIKIVPMPGFEAQARQLRTIPLDPRDISSAPPVENPNGDSLKGKWQNFILEKVNDGKVVNISGQLYVAGWGSLEEGSGKASRIPYRAEMILADTNDCKDEMGLQMNLSSIFCAIGRDYRSDSCQGDSGGAFYLQDGDKQTLVGTVSFGKGCGRREFKYIFFREAVPAVYTNVNYYRKFIQDSITVLRSSPGTAN